jgi:hypothetical protein
MRVIWIDSNVEVLKDLCICSMNQLLEAPCKIYFYSLMFITTGPRYST